MPAFVRVGDLCTGHGCFPPRPCIQGSPNVFANGKSINRVGDAWGVHCNCKCENAHSGVTARGSSSIRINSIPAARVGDPINCGSACAQGSFNTGGGF